MTTATLHMLDVTANNVADAGIYCIKDKKSAGFHKKIGWFQRRINAGVQIRIAQDDQGKHMGFIEFIPSEKAWRPVTAKNYMFIHCIGVFSKKNRMQGVGKALIEECEHVARQADKGGVCVMTSKGPWIATADIFERNGYLLADALERFELWYKPFDDHHAKPVLNDWRQYQENYDGWHLVFANQCPWHEKSIADIDRAAKEHGVTLTIKELKTPRQAQHGPSGFGTFALIKDGQLLADHYISRTRFENILKKEMHL